MIDIDWLLKITITSSILIVVITILRFTFKKILPRYIFVILWFVVLLKLSIFNNLSSSLSIYNINLSNKTQQAEQTFIENTNLINDNNIYETKNIIVNHSSNLDLNSIIMSIWISISAILLIVFIITYIKTYSFLKYKNLEYLTDTEIGNKKIGVYISSEVEIPMVIGVIKPKVLLPYSLNREDPILLKHILLHESIHVKRFDNALKLLAMLLLCIYWFNPFVWLVYKYLNQDIEISCDEKVVKVIGQSNKKSYAESLIKIVENIQYSKVYLFSTFGTSDLKQRMSYIMKSKKMNLLISGFSLFLVFGMITVFATNSKLITNAKLEVSNSSSPITEKEAINIALRKTNGGIITEYKLDQKSDNKRYKIEVINKSVKYKIGINSQTGEIISYKEKNIKDEKNSSYINKIVSNSKVNIESAKQIALKATDGGTVTSYELDIEEDQLFYDIEIVQDNIKYELDINAQTGEVIKLEYKKT